MSEWNLECSDLADVDLNGDGKINLPELDISLARIGAELLPAEEAEEAEEAAKAYQEKLRLEAEAAEAAKEEQRRRDLEAARAAAVKETERLRKEAEAAKAEEDRRRRELEAAAIAKDTILSLSLFDYYRLLRFAFIFVFEFYLNFTHVYGSDEQTFFPTTKILIC